MTLSAGQGLDVLARQSAATGGPSGTGTDAVPLLLSLTGAAAILGLAATGVARRRRRPPLGAGYEAHHA